MKREIRIGVWILLAVFLLGTAAAAAERSEIPEKYKWKLSDLYESPEAWKTEKDKVAGRLSEMEAFKGKLGESSDSLYRGLSTMFELKKEAQRIFIYSFMIRDQDTRIATNADDAN